MMMGVDIEFGIIFVGRGYVYMHAGSDCACCCTMMPGCRIGTKGAKALALELGYLSQLTVLDLRGE